MLDCYAMPAWETIHLPSLPTSCSVASDSEDNVERIGAGISITGKHRSNSYRRLPEPLLRLTVLKLDGSSFEVQVARTASVWQLKMAVEGIFSHPAEQGGVVISWSHVWGHFCLCYEHHKLIDDRAFLRSFGVKDGAQLHFIRHISVNFHPVKQCPRNHETLPSQHKMVQSELDAEETIEKHEYNTDSAGASQFEDQDFHGQREDEDLRRHTEFKFARLFGGWISYSRLWRYKKTRPMSWLLGSSWERIGSKPKTG